MFAGKKVRVELKGQARDSYLKLQVRNDKEAMSILRSIERVVTLLKTNPQLQWAEKEAGYKAMGVNLENSPLINKLLSVFINNRGTKSHATCNDHLGNNASFLRVV